MNNDTYELYKKVFRENKGILRVSTAIKHGVPKHAIYEMLRKHDLVQEARGLFRLAEFEPLGNPDLVQVSILIPKSVICLISSLYIHGLTTQIPKQVYIALPQGVKERNIDYPPLRVFHLSKRPFLAGIENLVFDGIKVKVYDKEKTIADCFKFRERIGIDIAVEALKDYMSQSSPNMRRLMEYARINRVEKLVRPYIETLL